MKPLYVFPLLLLLPLVGPALAKPPDEPATAKTSLSETCPLVGPMAGASDECQAIRHAYRARIADCMKEMQAEADARAGQVTRVSAHSNRARYLTCDAESRANLPRVSR